MVQKKKQLFILEQNSMPPQSVSEESIAVIIYLYYLDTIKNYITYIEAVPKDYDIYIVSSNDAVLEKARGFLEKREAVYILKENRGRDISAVLIAAAPVLKKYDRVCFIHDKSANAEYLEEDTAFWIYNLWTNTLGSEAYIRKINQLFDKDKTLGLLAPPEPYGEFLSHWYGDTWFENYDTTRQLAERLKLDVEVTQEEQLTTLSTVFWARTAALKKLMDYQWKYEDFPEEPLPIDGTLNHAIERIFPFVVLDAGFTTGVVMRKQYAEELLLLVQRDMRYMYFLLQERENVSNLHQIRCAGKWVAIAGDFFERHKNIYIYGAGYYGEKLYFFLKNRGINVTGFIITDGHKKEAEMYGVPIVEISGINKELDIGVVIGVSYEYRPEVEETLHRYGIVEYIEII